MKKYNLYFYNDINDNNSNVCMSKHKMSEKQFHDFLSVRSNKLLLTAMRKGHNIHKISGKLKIYCNMFEMRRKNKEKVSKEDHDMYIHCLSGLHRLNQLNIFDRILKLKIKNKKIPQGIEP
jgi:hypothetical protein